ncbi:hypothetical protein GCK72_021354 [Caenorhabditis remanei]|uniref:Uncharacterized protein n=2 Tax=Caenorhabditis remanei TaxID=31234 RepID=E3MGM0_CAERE|nr:hypothetical protein GCK72_021354 [Caenorhabditis remanei]EFP01844.1 hypothetical protein CRE_23404 [Caenorhabditis remanei]KAF1754790.1 hypothetical protein GCK72_021354 [Caenorhabditis remanei]
MSGPTNDQIPKKPYIPIPGFPGEREENLLEKAAKSFSIRFTILSDFKEGLTAKQTVAKINKNLADIHEKFGGPGDAPTIELHLVQYWFKRFLTGDHSLTDCANP